MLLSFLIALSHLFEAYFRLLPFSKQESEELKRKIFIYSALWCVASVFLYKIFFSIYGINSATYKVLVMFGWLPYLLISLGFLRGKFLQHIFVLGMSIIFVLIQHTITTIIILTYFNGVFDMIFYDALVYLLLFAIFLPLLRNFFVKLLPSREFFDFHQQGIYIAILPLAIVSAHVIRATNDILIHSWAERFSRIYLPLVFFFFYRYILSVAKNFYDIQRLERTKILLEEKLLKLKKYNEWIQENQKKISVMRHDLRHSYNIIYTLLENGEIDKALKHIRAQENLLEDKK